MDAVEYVKTVRRLCASHSDCDTCKLYGNGGCMFSFMEKEPEKAVRIVEQWAKDHPSKTRKNELLKMFPNADIDNILPCDLDKNLKRGHCHDDDAGCFYCKQNYWNKEVTDND